MSDSLTEAATQAAAGDAAALERFVRLSYTDVWRLCSYLWSPAEADDLTQEVYERALGSLAGFRGEASARTWLLAIARRVCADAHRRRFRRSRAEEAAARQRDLLASGVASIAPIEVRLLIGRLPVDQREAFVLTQLIGLPYAEAAAVCACPIGTIRSRVARAREALIGAFGADAAEA